MFNEINLTIAPKFGYLAADKGMTGDPNVYSGVALSNYKKEFQESFIKYIGNFLEIPAEDLNENLVVATVKFDDQGDHQRTYTPSLINIAAEGEPALAGIKFGDKTYALNTKSKAEFSAEVKSTLNGFNQLCVVAELSDDTTDTDVVMMIPVWLNDEGTKEFVSGTGKETSYNNRSFGKFIKNDDWATLATKLNTSKGGGTSKIQDAFPADVELIIRDVTPFEGKFGKNYILTLEYNGNTAKVYCPYKVRTVIEAGWAFKYDGSGKVVYTMGEKDKVLSRCKGQYLVQD